MHMTVQLLVKVMAQFLVKMLRSYEHVMVRLLVHDHRSM